MTEKALPESLTCRISSGFFLSPALHVFNPDTDYALGDGGRFYTPPRIVSRMRRELALFPATYATPGDMILLLDDISRDEMENSPYLAVMEAKRIKAVPLAGLQGLAHSVRSIAPWGWNATLLRILEENNAPATLLPSPERIAGLRELSHRRTTVAFHRLAPTIMPQCASPVPVELTSEDEVMDFCNRNPGCWLKAPWSSSGRGVMHTDDLEERHIRPWARGIIRRQGSVMGEVDRGRKLDFATEWMMSEGKAHFAGLSVFDTSSRGKYHGNRLETQARLAAIIRESCGFDPHAFIDVQSEILSRIVGTDYEGPAGIDMLVTSEGMVNLCVEINFRMTMGIANLLATR